MQKTEYFILEQLNNDDEIFFYSPLKDYCELIDITEEESLNRHIEIISKMPDISIADIHQKPPNLFLTLTNQCNLECLYCYTGPNDHSESSTTKAILKNAIEAYFIEINSRHLDHCTIGFMGGREPTCAFELMKYAIQYANELAETNQVKITYTMVTNGFYNQEISDFICDHFDQLSLSFDGPETIQNYQRPAPQNMKSYDRVLKNALNLKRSKVDWQIHVVVTAYNVHRLDETMRFFNTHFSDTKIVFAIMDQGKHTLNIEPPHIDLFHNNIEIIQNNYSNVEVVVERNLNTLKKQACISVANQDWYISEKGIVETCMRSSHSNNDVFSIGYFDSEKEVFKFFPDKIENLKKFDIQQQEDCKICFAKYLCGGGCPYLRNNGDWNCDLTRLYAKKSIVSHYHEKKIRDHLWQLFP